MPSNVYDFFTGLPKEQVSEESIGKTLEDLLFLVGAMDIRGFAMYIQTGSMGAFTAVKGENTLQVADEAISSIKKHMKVR